MADRRGKTGKPTLDVLERIAALPGELYVFVDYHSPDGRDLPIGDLRQRLLQVAEKDDDIRAVILVDGDKLSALEERLNAIINHKDILPLFSSDTLPILVGLSLGGGGIGDIRRVYRLEKGKDGQYSHLSPTSDVLKIVERPHKNLANTDLELLEFQLPKLTAEKSHLLTGISGIARALRREELTVVQKLEYIPGFVSFRKVLDDVAHPFCSAPFILEVLKQAALGLKVLHDQGIAHRDFKADAIVLQWREELPHRLRRAVADLMPESGYPQVSASGLYRRSVRARIFDYDTAAVVGRAKDPNQTTSSSENARIENPRELAEVYAQSDQYPLGIALLRLFPGIWSEVRGVMRSGMAVAVPMKLMMVREELEQRKEQVAKDHAELYGCAHEDGLLLIQTLLKLIAFEPEERFDNLAEVAGAFTYLQEQVAHEPLAVLMARHGHLFDDAEQLIAGLSRRKHEGAGTFFALPGQARAGVLRAAAPWAAVLVLGALAGGGMARYGQNTPTPLVSTQAALAVDPELPAAEETQTPAITPIPEDETPGPRRLDLPRMDWQRLDEIRGLAAGEDLTIDLPVEGGEDGFVRVRREGVGSATRYHFELDMPGADEDYPASERPVDTIQEQIMSALFANYCHGSSPDAMRQFIERMPGEPVQGGAPISTRFTVCEGSEPHYETLYIERQSRLQFAIGLGIERVISRKPRLDACALLNDWVVEKTGQGAFASCSNLGLKFGPATVPEVVPETGEVKAAPALVLRELSIENTDEEIIYAAREIAALESNHRILLRLDGQEPIEIIKTDRRLSFNGRVLNTASGTEYSALLKAIHTQAEALENL